MPQVRQGNPVRARNGQMVNPTAQSSAAAGRMKATGRQRGVMMEDEDMGDLREEHARA